MQVQNTTEHYISFAVRTNPGEMVKGYDANNNEIRKPAMPQLLTITIPGLATVELDDKHWNAAIAVTSTRQQVTLEKEPVQLGTDKPGVNAEHFISVPIGDGKRRKYNPVMDLVKSGQLKVVEHAKSLLTEEEMRKAVEQAQGYALPKDLAIDKLQAAYNLHCM